MRCFFLFSLLDGSKEDDWRGKIVGAGRKSVTGERERERERGGETRLLVL